MISASHVGCAASRNKGNCSSSRAFSRTKVEARILGAFATRLIRAEAIQSGCRTLPIPTSRKISARVERWRLEQGFRSAR